MSAKIVFFGVVFSELFWIKKKSVFLCAFFCCLLVTEKEKEKEKKKKKKRKRKRKRKRQRKALKVRFSNIFYSFSQRISKRKEKGRRERDMQGKEREGKCSS